jgi:hypothetical protein
MELKISYQKSADGDQTKSLKHEQNLSESKCGDRKKVLGFYLFRRPERPN